MESQAIASSNFETSSSIKEVAAALVYFHSKIGKVGKDSNNPFLKNKYASLSKILTEVTPILVESGLIVTQFPTGENELITMLTHAKTGEYFKSTMKMVPQKPGPQEQGSVITYMRRYSLGAILSLNIDEDDDGTKASRKPAPGKVLTMQLYESPAVQGAIKKYLDQGLASKDIIKKIKAKFNGGIDADVEAKIKDIGHAETT